MAPYGTPRTSGPPGKSPGIGKAPQKMHDLLAVLDDDAPADRLGWRSAFEARKGSHQAVAIVPCRRRWFEDQRR